MQTIRRPLLIVAFCIGLAAPAVAFAQQAPAPPPPGGTLQQRVEQRKRERNIKLEPRDEQRLKGRCQNAQSVIRNLQQQTSPLATKRARVYQQVDAKLWVAIGRLKLADRDTRELEKQRAALANKVAAFQTTMTDYQQTIDDAVVMNCQADLAGFRAVVETTRLYQDRARAQAVEIQTYIVDTIKPALGTFATELQPKAATEEGN